MKNKKSFIGAILVFCLVCYAVFFPHPERGPRDVASEILPSQAAVSDIKGSPRDVAAWQQLHKQYIEEIKARAAKKEVHIPHTALLHRRAFLLYWQLG